jgi:hypothetical protein
MFLENSFPFCGIIASSLDVTIDPVRLDVILKLKAPTTLHQLQCVLICLIIVGGEAKGVQNFGCHLTKPLHPLQVSNFIGLRKRKSP